MRRLTFPLALVLVACVAAGNAGARPLQAACTPDTTYSPPGALPLDTSRPGLTTKIEPPHFYRVDGDTVAELQAAMSQCSPASADHYWGYERNWVNYQYTTASESNGLCRIDQVAVGVHASTILPSWTPGPGAAPGLAGEWRRFLAALTVHEHGHQALALTWGKKLLSDLETLPAQACSSIGARISQLATNDLDSLQQAQEAYDARTHHGATQGAVLGTGGGG
jgi:predicted secreted Zn-dependent protease